MTTYNYTNKRQKLARILILCGVLQGLNACSTTVNFTDGIIVGETAQKEYNKRLAIKHSSSNKKINDKDRAELSALINEVY